ncbi:MAG: SixA phosphatase family protein [Bryobacteraceae bacterium]
MQIYLLRHGIAEDGRPGGRDADRALIPEGRKKLREVLRVARDAGVMPEIILTSPYRRARETAELAAGILGYKEELIESRSLIPLSTPQAAWEEIRVHKDASQILLAGHEPLFSQLFAYLLHCPELQVEFKKGSLARIDLDSFPARPRGVLRWLLTPKLASE